MAKSKVCIAAVLCVVSFFTILSCAKPKYVLRFDYKEAGGYQVDVANWFYFKDKQDTTLQGWTYTVSDAQAVVDAYYVQPGDGMAHFGGEYMAHLKSYEVSWGSGVKIPKTLGVIDALVPSDMQGQTKTPVTLTIITAQTKDTCQALSSLQASPENGEFFNGALDVKATVKVMGTDQLTGEDISGEFQMFVNFADYLDPSKVH